MLATIELLQIIEKAEHIGDQIILSDVAEHYRDCMNKMQNDRKTQQKISAFLEMKDLYEDVQRFGRYHPDYKEIMVETRQRKRDMDLDDNVANFRKAETELQSLLDQISVLIAKSVSEHIKVPTGNPFFETGSSCGGNCGTGGGCGCST